MVVRRVALLRFLSLVAGAVLAVTCGGGGDGGAPDAATDLGCGPGVNGDDYLDVAVTPV